MIIMLLHGIQFCATAQNWTSVGTLKFNFSVDQLYADTNSGQLYSTGIFWMIDTTSAYGLGVLDSSEWVNAFAPVDNNGSKSIVNYQGTIYIARSPYVLRWNSISWDTVAIASGVTSFYNDGDSILYILGSFSSVNSISASSIAKFDGSTWSCVDTTIWSGAVTCAYRFQGDMYFGGLFENFTNNIHRIARWDGINWHSLGGGITGSIAWVNCLEEYNGNLFVGGYMDIAQGNPGNHIARWDGNSWTQVGGGMWGGQVRELQVFNNELWAVGQFDYAGGINASYVARYDGLNWCSVGTFDMPASTIAVLDSELYVGGGFWTVDGDSVNKVVKWIGGSFADSCGHLETGIDAPETTNIVIYPNPASSILTFQFEDATSTRSIVVTDHLGRKVWQTVSNQLTVDLPAHEFANGMYFYTIIEDQLRLSSGKFLIEH
jgi:Secretion system C-terminal sorting domain